MVVAVNVKSGDSLFEHALSGVLRQIEFANFCPWHIFCAPISVGIALRRPAKCDSYDVLRKIEHIVPGSNEM